MTLFLTLLVLLTTGALLWLFALLPRLHSPKDLTALASWRYAHRGYHDQSLSLPENSLGAFQRAVQEGFGAELDVHLSKDSHLVVMHDESLLRMCGKSQRVADLTVQELSLYHLANTNEPIPLLEQVLPVFEGKTPLIIELKTCDNNAAALCNAVMQQLRDYTGLYCLESFDPRVLIYLKKHYPQVVRGQLSENYFRHKTKLHPVLKFLLQNLLLNIFTRPDFIAYCVHDWSDRSFTLCRRFWGTQVFGWTVRSKDEQTIVEATHGAIIFEHFDPR